MKDRKRQLENLAFMIRQPLKTGRPIWRKKDGWWNSRGPYFWKYRRIEPKRLAVNVVYFPKASEFDPSPTEGQIQLEELCKRDGWILRPAGARCRSFIMSKKIRCPLKPSGDPGWRPSGRP